MFALLVWACLASNPSDCKVYAIARGMADARQCEAYSFLMVRGWIDLYPNLVMRAGTRPMCVNNPEWVMGRFGA